MKDSLERLIDSGTPDEVVEKKHKHLNRHLGVSDRDFSRTVLAEGMKKYPEDVVSQRPKTRADCITSPRPCPFISCRHHLYIEVHERSGSISFNFPDKEVWELENSCTLDLIKPDGMTLDEVGKNLNLTREYVRQVEEGALEFIQIIKEGEALAEFKDHTFFYGDDGNSYGEPGD